MTDADQIDCIVRCHDFRRLAELERCLFSLVGQNYRPLHVIIATQRFTEQQSQATRDRLAPLVALSEGVRLSLVNWAEAEPRDARTVLLNLGLKAADGHYVAFLDYDDLLYPEAYDLLASRLAAGGGAIAFASVRTLGLAVHEHFFEVTGSVPSNFSGKSLRDLFCHNFCPIHSYLIDRRQVPPAMLYFDETLTQEEDYDLLLRICAAYPADFSLLGTVIGEYFYKTDGSNTVPTAWNPVDAARALGYARVMERIESRRQATLVAPVVQQALGLARPRDNLCIRDVLAMTAADGLPAPLPAPALASETPSPVGARPALRRQAARAVALIRRPRQALRLHRQEKAVLESGLFDAEMYAAENPDVIGLGLDPLAHFLQLGGQEGRSPHRLFDAGWYLQANPDIAAGGVNPLVHYLSVGWREGRVPHPLFDARWYAAKYGVDGANPLLHFLRQGAPAGCRPNPHFDTTWYVAGHPGVDWRRVNPLAHYLDAARFRHVDPSLRFDSAWYAEIYPDVAASCIDPLLHYLYCGAAEGRRATPPPVDAAATAAAIRCGKRPVKAGEVAILVSRGRRLPKHLLPLIAALRRQGIAVVLVTSATLSDEAGAALASVVHGLYRRDDDGCDLLAWAHILHLHPEFFGARLLYLLTDGLGSPREAAFGTVIGRLRDHPGDVIGLTETDLPVWHLHPAFLALKQGALAAVAVQTFFHQLAVSRRRDSLLAPRDLRLMRTLRIAGLVCASLFGSTAWNGGVPGVAAIPDLFGVPVEPPPEGGDRLPALPAIPPRVAFIGPWNMNNGQAVGSRAYISALKRTGMALNLHPITRPFHIHQRIAPSFDICDFHGAADVALVLVNADGWEVFLTGEQRDIIDGARRSVGLWVWELAQIPPQWFPVFDQVDAIWAPSGFCADSYRARAKVPVDLVPYPVAVDAARPDPRRAAIIRRQLGLAADQRIILYVFDGASYLIRKNPAALVRAFARSGLAESGWRLVLKTKNLFDSPKAGRALQRLVERAPGVILIDRSLDGEMLGELMLAADIYASPHCSEGFGLTVAEAMAMGKIVVATDFGGTRDFVLPSTGFPVGYQLQSLETDGPVYHQGGVWATVDEPHLADCLLRAAALVAAGDDSLGRAARRHVETTLSPTVVAARIEDSLTRLLSDG